MLPQNFKASFKTSNSKFYAIDVVHIPLTLSGIVASARCAVVALPFVLIVRQNGVGRLSGRVLGLNHRKIPHYVIIVTTDAEQETLKQFRAQESKTLQLTQLGVGMFPLFGPIQKLYM